MITLISLLTTATAIYETYFANVPGVEFLRKIFKFKVGPSLIQAHLAMTNFSS